MKMFFEQKNIGFMVSDEKRAGLLVSPAPERWRRLSIQACAGAHVDVRDCVVINRGWPLVEMEPGGEPKGVSIRGYAPDKSSGLIIQVTEPGRYELSGEGVLTQTA